MSAIPVPDDLPTSGEPAAARIVSTKIFVNGLKIEAEVGVYRHERGRRQPLVVDVELDVAVGPVSHLADTLNYETIAAAAHDIAAQGHVELIETYAERLAAACLADGRVTRARVRVEKPTALPPATAGVEIVAVRG